MLGQPQRTRNLIAHRTAKTAAEQDWFVHVERALTFDMRGGRQLAKPDVGRPLDGRVRRHCRDAPCLMAARMAKAALRLALVADPSYFSWADWRNSMALASACL